MKERHHLILSAEESLARRGALSTIVARPVNPWLQTIPGKFVFDFLKRTAEIRAYSQQFMFPRRLALVTAKSPGNTADQSDSLSMAEGKIHNWLASKNLGSSAIFKAQIDIFHLLRNHYGSLLEADGDTYAGLVVNAYQTIESYESYLKELTDLEQKMVGAITEFYGPKAGKDIIDRQYHLVEQRLKQKEEIFMEI